MKIAFVYDRVNKWGGAERVLLALHQIWPKAPLYTAVYNPAKAVWADIFKVKTSYLQKIPFTKRHHEYLSLLTPEAFSSFDFSKYDVVISITSAEAKFITKNKNQLHICYCLTPTRYLWSHKDFYQSPQQQPFLLYLQEALLKNHDQDLSLKQHHQHLYLHNQVLFQQHACLSKNSDHIS